MTFVLQPIPRSLVAQGIAKGGNALGLPLEDHQCELSGVLQLLLILILPRPLPWPRPTRGAERHFPVSHTRLRLTNAAGTPGWTTLVDWAEPKDDAAVQGVITGVVDKWAELTRERGLVVGGDGHDGFVYMNDARRDQNPLASYGAANVARLRAVSKKYDPAQVFQKLQHDGFLLRKLS